MKESSKEYGSKRIILTLLVFILLILMVVCLFLGRYPSLGITKIRSLSADPLALRILLHIRLPRVLMAVILGMSLSAAGLVFQLLFSNPLVEAGFLGVSQGSAFGAALAIILWGQSLPRIQVLSGLLGLTGLITAYLIARGIRFGGWLLRLLLSGLAVSAIFSAGLGFLKYIADPLTQLPDITFWLLGGLSGITWERLFSVLPAIIISFPVLAALRWKLNILTLSDQTAFSLGLAPNRTRLLLIIFATLPVTASISVSGIVQWIGLIVPHFSRLIFSSDSRFSLPGAVLIGGILGLLCDTAARVLLPGEIPLGIITSFFGAAVFILLLRGRRTNLR